MPQVSRIATTVAELFARNLTQEAVSGVIQTNREETTGESVAANQHAKNALTRILPQKAKRGLSPQRGREAASEDISPNDPRVRLLRNQCLKLSLSLFNRAQRATRSLGFTSAISGEGKTFLATLAASALAERAHRSVTLVDCNWDAPTLHERFDIPNTPGLAEWLRDECELADIRHVITPYLTVIPGGDASQDALALAERFRAVGAQALLATPEELLIADLPAVLTSDYGALLPQLLDSVLLVVRAGVTQDTYIAEASRELVDSPVEGAILNATRSSIPRWLQRLL